MKSGSSTPACASGGSNWAVTKAPNGEEYYYNKKTKEVSWDPPPGFTSASMDVKPAVSSQKHSAAAPAGIPAPGSVKVQATPVQLAKAQLLPSVSVPSPASSNVAIPPAAPIFKVPVTKQPITPPPPPPEHLYVPPPPYPPPPPEQLYSRPSANPPCQPSTPPPAFPKGPSALTQAQPGSPTGGGYPAAISYQPPSYSGQPYPAPSPPLYAQTPPPTSYQAPSYPGQPYAVPSPAPFAQAPSVVAPDDKRFPNISEGHTTGYSYVSMVSAHGVQALHPSGPGSGSASGLGQRSFSTSTFRQMYRTVPLPYNDIVLLSSLQQFLHIFAVRNNLPQHTADAFLAALRREAFGVEGGKDTMTQRLDELLGSVPGFAQRLWTSVATINVGNNEMELCTLINFALREDDPTMLQHLLVRAPAMCARSTY